MSDYEKKLKKLKSEATSKINSASTLDELYGYKSQYTGKNSYLNEVLRSLKEFSIEERKSVGTLANVTGTLLKELIIKTEERLSSKLESSDFDLTLPGTSQPIGTIHILNQVMNDICRTFYGMGFEIAKGPDIETDYYNFEALNFPPDHPARDMQDTLFVENDRVLRTHTTPVQARFLETHKPPIKIITPGKTFRNEAISTRAHVAFHQVDGFLVDEGVSIADLKGALVAFCKAFFGEDIKLNFRPSFFPFTEPSAEVDVFCILCKGKGCQLCKYTGWLEILGCGMIDPNVLDMAKIDSEKYTGYAFGMGVERIAMLKYKINDVRLFFNNDIRFLRQFI